MVKCQVQVRKDPCSLEELFSFGNSAKYIVPLYQREYAWGNVEITQLLNDFYEAFQKDPNRTYHIGIVVIIRRSASYNGSLFELIDGQQRFTTLSILYRLLHEGEQAPVERKVFFENRPEAEIFLNDLFQNARTNNLNPWAFRNAVEVIREFHYDDLSWEELLKQPSEGAKNNFRYFLLNNVKLFVVEMPLSTDVSRYFEIMNNRGRQLEPHELLKAQLMQRLRLEHREKSDEELDELCQRFDAIWNALAHMDDHFEYFAHAFYNYNDETSLAAWMDVALTTAKDNVDAGYAVELQSVINDFPNFLMQVLKQYCNYMKWKDSNGENLTIPLDDRQFKRTFDDIIREKTDFSATEFIGYIIRMRLKYDRFVVKARFENNEVKGWSLQRVQKSSSSSYNLINTYNNDVFQQRLVKLQSMLQVTYRSRRYKEWLQVILGTEGEDLEKPEIMIGKLSQYVHEKLWDLCGKNSSDLLHLGLNTPHIVFNLVDYLLWLKEDTKSEFVFTYRSSIEHHQPQDGRFSPNTDSSENTDPKWIDSLGNLCLVYSNENSSMSNHAPVEKLRGYRNEWKAFPPKRRLMYQMTNEAGGWNKDKCQKHTEQLKQLLNDFLSKNSDEWIKSIKNVDQYDEMSNPALDRSEDTERLNHE